MSRALTFWTDDNIQLIKDHFIAASVPTWVARSEGPEGDFLRSADVHKQWVTSSGYMTCISASGKRLGGRPSMQVLEEFKKLPESERRPGAIQVRDLEPEQRVIPEPPKGGLVLRVHARFLARGDDGQLRHVELADFPLLGGNSKLFTSRKHVFEPNTEYMWLTRGEWQGLVPAEPAVGQTIEIAPIIAERMARFHLTPQRATTSEGGIRRVSDVKKAALRLAVRELTPQKIEMDLQGFVHWGSDYDESKATTPNGPLAQGYATPLYGRVEFDRAKNVFTRFDIVAPGEVWGRWGDANGKSMAVERPGRNPFGFALELASGDSPTDRIPPGGNGHYVSERTGYFSASR